MKIPAAKAAVDKVEQTNSRFCEFGANLHLATLMDLSHLKHSELAEYLQKYRGRVALRGEDVKDDARCQAVFAEQGSSQMTAKDVPDTESCLLRKLGEANDAVTAFTQVNMKDAPRLLKLRETECSTIWIRLPYNRRPANWDTIDDVLKHVRVMPVHTGTF